MRMSYVDDIEIISSSSEAYMQRFERSVICDLKFSVFLKCKTRCEEC